MVEEKQSFKGKMLENQFNNSPDIYVIFAGGYLRDYDVIGIDCF